MAVIQVNGGASVQQGLWTSASAWPRQNVCWLQAWGKPPVHVVSQMQTFRTSASSVPGNTGRIHWCHCMVGGQKETVTFPSLQAQ